MSSVPQFNVPVGVSQSDARLAWELVAGISSIGDVMRRHQMSFDDLDAKKRDPVFANMLDQYRKHWNSELSVNQRVALKAALLTEDSLLDIYAIIKDTEASPGQKLEAFGALAKAGEVGAQRKEAGVAGTPVHITINVPGKPGVTLDAIPVTEENSNG
jgi:hypothetical protein